MCMKKTSFQSTTWYTRCQAKTSVYMVYWVYIHRFVCYINLNNIAAAAIVCPHSHHPDSLCTSTSTMAHQAIKQIVSMFSVM